MTQMKKTHLILTLVLSTQVLLSGCSVMSKLKNNSTQQAQTQSNSSDSAQATDKSKDTTSTDNNTVTPKDVNNNQTSNSTNSLKSISKKDIQDYSAMTKATLIKTLGKDYKSQGSTLTFSNGLSFYELSKNESKPTLIKCSNNVDIMGIKNGITFAQVQSILGKAKVIDTYIGTKTNKAYKIQYAFGKDLLKVISTNKDGKDSFIEICPQ
jgi:uncharacterized protein YceK